MKGRVKNKIEKNTAKRASGGKCTSITDCEPDGGPIPKGKKTGGPVSGAMPKKRLDKPRRFATGGGVTDDGASTKKSKKSGTTVNIVITGKGGPDGGAPAMAPPMPPAAGPAAMPPVAPPMPPAGRPPVGGPSAGMAPPPRPFKRGGGVKTDFNAGAGGGKGRLEKAAAQRKKNPDGPGKRGGK